MLSAFVVCAGKGMLGLALVVVGGLCSMPAMANVSPRPVVVGAEVLLASGFASLAGKRVGLIANQTSLANGSHLADLLKAAPGVRLAAILAPEHGFRGASEAGASVGHAVDEKTGVPVWSLYGRARKPTPAMLRGIDVLVFDVQDIGARFYTYISTLGLAMQAAAAAKIPFVVLDRPNPLGGDDVAGFVLEGSLRSFVGQYPIPIVHGLTVGEIARMIKGEGWLDGLERLDLKIVKMENWQRAMRWPETRLTWVPTSPNIPTFQSALLYPGIGLVGETNVNEGRGTATPFAVFGAPWLQAPRLIERLNRGALAGVRFEAAELCSRFHRRRGQAPTLCRATRQRCAAHRDRWRARATPRNRRARAGGAHRGGPRGGRQAVCRQRGNVSCPGRHKAALSDAARRSGGQRHCCRLAQ